MDWTEPAIYGLIGALSAALAVLVERMFRKSAQSPTKILRIALIGVFFIGFQNLYTFKFRPLVITHQTRATLLSMPLYAAIAQKDPDLFNEILSRTSAANRPGATADQITDAVGDLVGGPRVQKYFASAPDNIVNRFVDVMIRTLKIRRDQAPEACYLTMYPKLATPAQRPLISYKNLPQDVQNETMAVLTAAVVSPPVLIFTDTSLPERLMEEKVAPPLAKAFGANLQLFLHPDAPSADRAKVCDVSIALFAQIRTLEPSESAVMLRYVFAQ